MYLNIIITSLIVSVSVHGSSIVFYILNRSKKSFIVFAGTFFSNLILFVLLFIYLFKNPAYLKEINFLFYSWVLSGFTSSLLLFIKINIARKVLIRRKDKDMYHLNYFGKKVYHGEIVLKKELRIFLASIPFFLLTVAFFVAVIINIKRLGLIF